MLAFSYALGVACCGVTERTIPRLDWGYFIPVVYFTNFWHIVEMGP